MECTGLNFFVSKFYVVLGGLVTESQSPAVRLRCLCISIFKWYMCDIIHNVYYMWILGALTLKVKAPKIHIAQAESGLLHPGAKY